MKNIRNNQGISTLAILFISAVIIGGAVTAAVLVRDSGQESDMSATTSQSTSTADIAVEEEGVKRTVRDDAEEGIAVEEEGSEQTVREDSQAQQMNSDANDADDDGDTAPPAPEEESEPVVTYTADGFSPQEITVSVGETVRFENESGTQMWVASDEHPTHENYAGTTRSEHCPDTSGESFDQCESGDVYSFTFNKAGTFNYHNHVDFSDTGSITVQ